MSTDIKPGQGAGVCGNTLDAFHFACILRSGHHGYHEDKNGGAFGPYEERDATPAHGSDSQLAAALMPLADAPDIENVPAASSMHALMEAVADMHHTLRRVQETLAFPQIHQPAPEPEWEWKPGTVGTAEVVREGANGGPRLFRRTRGMVVHRPAPIDDDMFVTVEGDLWALEGNYCKNFVPDEPRPTRDALTTALQETAQERETRSSFAEDADLILAALLRGESR